MCQCAAGCALCNLVVNGHIWGVFGRNGLKLKAGLYCGWFAIGLMLNVANADELQLAPDGSWVRGEPRLAPDGSWVGGDPQLAPDGSWVGGDDPKLAPDGSWVGGDPQLAPDGSWVGGDPPPLLAPDGTWK